MIRGWLHAIRHRTAVGGRVVSRFTRVVRYAWDLVIWTRLLSRRGPVQVAFPASLLASKEIHFQPPVLSLSGPPSDVGHWDEGFAAVNANLFLNLQMPDLLSEVRYAHPAPAFRGIYLWDSAFIAQVWKHWDRDVAADICTAVLAQRDGARLQHVVSDLFQSEYTQPPLLAWSIARLYGGHPPEAALPYLRQVFPILWEYHEWLYQHRRLDNGLFFWKHPYESGIDNSPRFSSVDERVFADTRRLAAPDLSAYVVLQCESLAEIATLLDDEAAAHACRERAEQLIERMNEFLWHAEDGFYYDRHIDTGEFIRCRTVASLLPLWAGVPTPEMAERLSQHISDPQQFNTPIPIPTVALNDSAFVKDMWCGPVWINTAYAVIAGLERYGHAELAAELAFRLCDGVYRTYGDTRHLYEFYDPERCDIEQLNRKQGNRFKLLTLGGKPVSEFVGWTGLVNTLAIEHLIGFRYENGRRVLRPSLPRRCEGLGFSLRLPAEDLAISLDFDTGGQYRAVFRSRRGTNVAEFARGEAVDIDAVLDGTSAAAHAAPSHPAVRSVDGACADDDDSPGTLRS